MICQLVTLNLFIFYYTFFGGDVASKMTYPKAYAFLLLLVQILLLGRDYPDGLNYVRERAKREILKHRLESDPEKIKGGIAKIEYIIKEMEALIQLKKYRTLKRRYYDEDRQPWNATPLVQALHYTIYDFGGTFTERYQIHHKPRRWA